MESQPNWIQDPQEPSSSQEVPRNKFPRLAWVLGVGWGAAAGTQGSGCVELGPHGGQRGHGRKTEHMGSQSAGKVGNLSFPLLDHLLLVPSRPSFWAPDDLSVENLDHGLSWLRDP